MTLSQIDLSIILGRSQNQALDIIRTDALINHDIEFEAWSREKSETYNALVEILFKLNKEQQERLVSIAPNVAKEIIPPPNVKKVIEPKTQAKELSPKQKACPKCNEIIPKLFKYHTCGWKEV